MGIPFQVDTDHVKDRLARQHAQPHRDVRRGRQPFARKAAPTGVSCPRERISLAILAICSRVDCGLASATKVPTPGMRTIRPAPCKFTQCLVGRHARHAELGHQRHVRRAGVPRRPGTAQDATRITLGLDPFMQRRCRATWNAACDGPLAHRGVSCFLRGAGTARRSSGTLGHG